MYMTFYLKSSNFSACLRRPTALLDRDEVEVPVRGHANEQKRCERFPYAALEGCLE